MSCEFLGHEYKPDKARVFHERVFCVANGEGCLVDDPLGYTQCTRRTFLLMQGIKESTQPKRPKRKRIDTSQYALL
jgi:hypothetical protein